MCSKDDEELASIEAAQLAAEGVLKNLLDDAYSFLSEDLQP